MSDKQMLENIEEAIKNGQPKETGKTKTNKTKNTTQYALDSDIRKQTPGLRSISQQLA